MALLLAASVISMLIGKNGPKSKASIASSGMVAESDARSEHDAVRLAVNPPSAASPMFVQLSIAANAGDVRAACTLGMLLELCASREASEEFGRALLDGAASSSAGGRTELDIVARVQAIESAHRRYESFCASLGPAESAQSHARMLQAVRLGSPQAAVRFFLRPQLKTRSGALSLNRAADYSAHAIDGLQRAAERGNALAIYHLFMLLATGEFNSNEVALSADVQRGKAIALGRAILPVLDPPSAVVVREKLQTIETQASLEERREAGVWASRFTLAPAASSLDGLADVAEDVSRCDTE
ncbi:MAG: hypothetical protein KF800_15380 [Lysobacter sp.]|nr:hypothetical protein [Lysobacter sp.]